MLRHIVIWNHKEGFTEEEKIENAKKVKDELEALKSCIEGIAELNVYIDPLSSSNKDVILNSLFESNEALLAYQIHPEHKKVSAFVGAVMENRVCMDYYE